MHSQNAIELVDVRKSYRIYPSRMHQAMELLGMGKFMRHTYEDIEALKNISLTIRRGERVGVVGRNGSGKSTLLKLITRNYLPSSGTVNVDGRLQSLMDAGLGFNYELPGIENVKNSLIYNGLSYTERMAAIKDILEFSELGEFINFPVKTYSLGMASRLAFGTATAIKPEILLIDEILGAGDGYFSLKSAERVQNLTQYGTTLILVSHSNAQVVQFCERAIWIDAGKVIADGAAIEVIKEYDKFIRDLEDRRISEKNKRKIEEHLSRQNEPEASIESSMFSLKKNQPKVSRWAGSNELKIQSVNMLDAQGLPTAITNQNDSASFSIDIRGQVIGTFSCQYHIKVFNATGVPVSLYLSEEDFITISEVNEIKSVQLKFKNLSLGEGDYLITVALYKIFDLNEPNNSIRYDLLDRSFSFSVVGKFKFNDCITQIPATWLTEKNKVSDLISPPL